MHILKRIPSITTLINWASFIIKQRTDALNKEDVHKTEDDCTKQRMIARSQNGCTRQRDTQNNMHTFLP
jgi:hypothetical protein